MVAALERLGVRRLALGAPYSAETTAQGRAHLEAYGFTVVRSDNLKGVTNIYDRPPSRPTGWRARSIGRRAEAVFLSGTGMPTLPVLDDARTAISASRYCRAASAMMWHALRTLRRARADPRLRPLADIGLSE